MRSSRNHFVSRDRLRSILNEAKAATVDFYLQRLSHAIASATRGMTPEQLMRHAEGKWCTAEILEHLYLTYTGTVKGLERCLASGKPLATSARLWHCLSTFAVTSLGYFPTGRKAPERATPRGLPGEKVLAEILPQIAAMDEILRRCEERYGAHIKLLDHPVLGPLNARQWRKFHWVHGRHHVKQIRRARGLIGM